MADARLAAGQQLPGRAPFERQTGVGDFNIIAPCLIDTGNPALSVGVGPQLTAPTATKDTLRSGKWSTEFQPFAFWQIGGGTYLRSTGVMAWNLERQTYSVPVGLGIGQVIPTRSAMLNLFAEPQMSVADKGVQSPRRQVFVGLNIQFKPLLSG